MRVVATLTGSVIITLNGQLTRVDVSTTDPGAGWETCLFWPGGGVFNQNRVVEYYTGSHLAAKGHVAWSHDPRRVLAEVLAEIAQHAS